MNAPHEREMAMSYVKKSEAFRKMKLAEDEYRPVIILAHAGWGKTALVENYFKRRSFLLLSGDEGKLDKMPQIEKIRQGVVVVDGVTWIDDVKSQEYIVELLEEGSRHVVLVGRGRFPRWLESVSLQTDFVRINHNDFRFEREDVCELFMDEGVELSIDQANLLMEMTKGYPPALKICLRHCAGGEPVDRITIARTRTEIFNYYEEAFYKKIKTEAQELLLEMCELESFTAEMAAELTGTERIHDVIDYCETVGSFIVKASANSWRIIGDVREFIRWKRSMVWSAEDRIDNNRRIAAWFDKEGKLAEAADFYENVGDLERIWELLVKNSRLHPGIGQYHVLRKHYESLPEEIIIQEPSLITGISLLKSMTMRPEESERWYRELEQFEKNSNNPPEKRKEAKAYLNYLDIGLPHRAGKGMIRNMKSAINLIGEKDIKLPEFSVTDNIPSVLDGGLDYSEWTKNADQIMRFMGSILEKILGRHGKGLKNIGLAEAGFERDSMEPHEVFSLANRGIAEATSSGSAEVCFAGYGVLIYQSLVLGNTREARDYLESFRDRVINEGELHLIPNIKATDALIALYESDYDRIRKWLSETPDVHRDFSIMDRFIYQVKIQCLIAIDSLPAAMSLSSYMDWYYREYDRTFSRIENEIFNAIIFYRQGIADWNRIMEEAMAGAEKYHYVQVAAMKGSAVLPLLTELKTDRVSEAFLKEVRSHCRETALRYPDFMKHNRVEIPQLTGREQEILGMLCAGETMENICERCGISYSGLKKHNRNIYAKLGAKNRAEAERIAVSVGLVQK